MGNAVALIKTSAGEFELPLLSEQEWWEGPAGERVRAAKQLAIARPDREILLRCIDVAATAGFEAGVSAALHEQAASVLHQEEELRATFARLLKTSEQNLRTVVSRARDQIDALLPRAVCPEGNPVLPTLGERAKLRKHLEDLIQEIPGWPATLGTRLARGKCVRTLLPGRCQVQDNLRIVTWPLALSWFGTVVLYAREDLRLDLGMSELLGPVLYPAGAPVAELHHRLLRVELGELRLPAELLAALLSGRLTAPGWQLRELGPETIGWRSPGDRVFTADRAWLEMLLQASDVEEMVKAGWLGEREAALLEEWLGLGPEQHALGPEGENMPVDSQGCLRRLLEEYVPREGWTGTVTDLLARGGSKYFESEVSLGMALGRASRDGLPGWEIRRTREPVSRRLLWPVRRVEE
ncbi:MAG TPA: hypothetical protein GXX55_05865 [Firmicutes bacterium]|nr:hypothetical protein [Bacillota bacterium]